MTNYNKFKKAELIKMLREFEHQDKYRAEELTHERFVARKFKSTNQKVAGNWYMWSVVPAVVTIIGLQLGDGALIAAGTIVFFSFIFIGNTFTMKGHYYRGRLDGCNF